MDAHSSSRHYDSARAKSSSLGPILFLGVVAVAALGVILMNVMSGESKTQSIPFDGARAYQYLKDICAIGTRVSGSAGMTQQQDLLKKHFRSLGADVVLQEFKARHPQTGADVAMANMIVTWHPDRNERILLCAHYDTRPFPDRDRIDPKGVFVGANDGASGVALLMELGREMPNYKGPLGVDFVLFDGEEFVFKDGRGMSLNEQGRVVNVGGDKYFLGSEHFAVTYFADTERKHRYRCGVLLDMVGSAAIGRTELFRRDYLSNNWPEVRPLVDEIWDTAKKLKLKEFVNRESEMIMDDHLTLRNIGKIPTCDIIGFGYKHWHTRYDTPDNCSPTTLAKVGWVLREWLNRTEGPGASVGPTP